MSLRVKLSLTPTNCWYYTKFQDSVSFHYSVRILLILMVTVNRWNRKFTRLFTRLSQIRSVLHILLVFIFLDFRQKPEEYCQENRPACTDARQIVTVKFRKVRSKLILTQIETECTNGQIYVYKSESIKIQTPIQWNVIGLSTSAPPSVLSHSSIFPPRSSYCNTISARKNAACVSQMLLFQFIFFLLL